MNEIIASSGIRPHQLSPEEIGEISRGFMAPLSMITIAIIASIDFVMVDVDR